MDLRCHCGNVSVSVDEKPVTLTQCNCSICHRYSSLWGYYPPERVSIAFKYEQPETYFWGGHHIDFNFCPQCGCVTHYTSTEKVPKPKVGVNFRMAPPLEIKSIKIRHFDGADTWKYLD